MPMEGGNQLQPEQIMKDFEIAAKNAWRAEFPNARLTGCFFHLGQCCWRKLTSLRFWDRYLHDEAFSVLCRTLPALAFIPPEHVQQTFMHISAVAPPEVVAELEDYFLYFEDTWVGGPAEGQHRRALHPIEEWSLYHATLNELPRTNNAVEAWHKAFQSTLSCQHPDIWKLVKAFKDEEQLQKLRMDQLLAGHALPRSRKYQEQSRRICRRVRRYGRTRNIMKYLRGLAHNVRYY